MTRSTFGRSKVKVTRRRSWIWKYGNGIILETFGLIGFLVYVNLFLPQVLFFCIGFTVPSDLESEGKSREFFGGRGKMRHTRVVLCQFVIFVMFSQAMHSIACSGRIMFSPYLVRPLSGYPFRCPS